LQVGTSARTPNQSRPLPEHDFLDDVCNGVPCPEFAWLFVKLLLHQLTLPSGEFGTGSLAGVQNHNHHKIKKTNPESGNFLASRFENPENHGISAEGNSRRPRLGAPAADLH
jgi:hypothetical protein